MADLFDPFYSKSAYLSGSVAVIALSVFLDQTAKNGSSTPARFTVHPLCQPDLYCLMSQKNMFSVKVSIPNGLPSQVVYKFTCAGFNACYVGETTGLSWRQGSRALTFGS